MHCFRVKRGTFGPEFSPLHSNTDQNMRGVKSTSLMTNTEANMLAVQTPAFFLKRKRHVRSAFARAEQHGYDGGTGTTPLCADGLHERKPSLVMPHKVACLFAAMGFNTRTKAMTNATMASFFRILELRAPRDVKLTVIDPIGGAGRCIPNCRPTCEIPPEMTPENKVNNNVRM
ncbi:unnamed protein product [Dovyalis caffra]|uniref:Uncharacterized protein n=1 Tax=Dovyalis caffra TaxID=77055 RepID=A0AAV1RB36_9ROSI|nr:unnamed protein product [Dovyalis caffra]